MQNQYVNSDSTIDIQFVGMMLEQFDALVPANQEGSYLASMEFIRFMHGEGQ